MPGGTSVTPLTPLFASCQAIATFRTNARLSRSARLERPVEARADGREPSRRLRGKLWCMISGTTTSGLRPRISVEETQLPASQWHREG